MSKSSFVASNNLNPILFKNHPYARIVNEEDFNRITRDDILFFYKKKFLKARRRIFFTGDVDIPKIEDIFRWHGMPRQLWYEKKIQPIVGYSPVNIHIPMKDSVQSSLRVAKPLTVNELHTDFPAIKMTNVILGGYFGSRLMSSLREHHGFTYGVNSAVNILRQGGSIVISTDVSNDVALKAIDAIFTELKKLNSEPVRMEELERVKKYMAGSILRSFDGCMAVGDVYKSLMSKGLPLDYYEKYFSDLMKLTPDDILKAAAQWFNPDTFSVLRVGDSM
jgi:predicted Zn-dependent peptidase